MASIVVFSRMQVSTSCSGRRAGWWYSTSLVASSGTFAASAMRCSPRQPALVVAAVEQARGEPDAIGAGVLQALQDFLRARRIEAMRQRQHQKLAFGEFQQVIEPQMAFALFDPLDVVAALAAGEQLAEPAVGGAVARIDQDVRRAIDEDEPRADQKLWLVRDLGVVEFLVGAHHAGQRVVVGDPDRGNAEFARLMHIGARIGAAAQEREIGGDADLGIAGRCLNARNVHGAVHANSPCTNHLIDAGLPSASASSLS